MNVIRMPANLNRVTLQFLTNTCKVSMKFFFYVRLNETRPVFGTKYDVSVNFNE